MRLFADRSSRRALAASFLLGALLAGLSCSDSSDIGPGSITSVRITPDTLRVLLGLTDTARAFPLDQDHAFLPKKATVWSTTDQAIATVNDSGIVTGVALGTTEVNATVAGVTGTATVIVEPRPVMVFIPDTARISGIAGSPNPASTSDTVRNGGGGALTGLSVDSVTYVSGATGWLQPTPNGTIAPVPVDLVANTSAVGLGRHVALVWLSSPDAPLPGSLPVVLTTTPDVATSIALQAGNGQTATVNTAVAVAPSVLVRDQFNNPVPNVAVTFAPTAGSGSVVGGNATTDANGIAVVTSWTLGTTVGGNTLHATSAGLAGSPVTFTATGTAGAAANLSINGGNNQAAVAGNPVAPPPSAKVTDTFGNAVAGTTVTFAVTSGGGQITGATPVSDASGVATLGSWTLGTTAGTNTLSATAAGLTGSPLTFTATGNPGNATNIALNSGDGQSGTVGTALAGAYVVKVTDNNNNPVPGVTVGWAPIGGGTMNPASSLTDVNGLASSTRTLGGAAGTQTATATVGGLIGSPVTFTATANPGAVTTIVVNAGAGQTATVNTAVGVAPSVVARDAFNNPVPGAAVTFTVTAGGGSVNCGSGATGACALNTNGSGIATVTNWILGTLAGTSNNSLSATRAGATGTSFTASATPGAVTQVINNGGNGQTAVRGTAVLTDPSVIVRDQFNNPVPGATVNFATITGTAGVSTLNCTGTAGLTSCNITSNASGVATLISWTLGTIGTPSVGAPGSGVYTNTVRASSNGVIFDFSGSSVWSFGSDVQPIFTANCVGCHFNGGQGPTLQSGSSYAAIRGVFSFACGAYVPLGFNSVGSSFLFNKINSATPCSGSQMPPGGPFLGTATQNIIRDWINNNSPNN